MIKWLIFFLISLVSIGIVSSYNYYDISRYVTNNITIFNGTTYNTTNNITQNITQNFTLNDGWTNTSTTTSTALKLQVNNSAGWGVARLFGLSGGTLQLQDATNEIYSNGSYIRFQSGDNDRMTILSTGNVGIGVIDPDEKLEVNGASHFGNRLDIYPGGSAVRMGILGARGDVGAGAPNVDDFVIKQMVDGKNIVLQTFDGVAMTLLDGGNVGIGTTTPIRTLHIDPATDVTTTFGTPLLQVGGDNSYAANGVYGIGLGYTEPTVNNPPTEIAHKVVYGGGYTYGDIIFGTRSVSTNTAPTERMRIDYLGNVGIGNTSPAYPLVVQTAVSGVSGWFFANVSADDYITHTYVYTGDSALAEIKDNSEYLNPDGSINHISFGYSFVEYEKQIQNGSIQSFELVDVEVATYDKNNTQNGTIVEKEQREVQTPTYTTIKEEGVSLGKEVALLKQAVFELKTELCRIDSKSQYCP